MDIIGAIDYRKLALYAAKRTIYADDPTPRALLLGNGASALGSLVPGSARNIVVSDGSDWHSRGIQSADLPDLSGTYLTVSAAGSGYQPLDGDLSAIAALTATGFARRTASNTWTAAALLSGDIPDLSADYVTLSGIQTITGAKTLSADLTLSALLKVTGSPGNFLLNTGATNSGTNLLLKSSNNNHLLDLQHGFSKLIRGLSADGSTVQLRVQQKISASGQTTLASFEGQTGVALGNTTPTYYLTASASGVVIGTDAGTLTPNVRLTVSETNALTNSASDMLSIEARTSATAAAGFGSRLRFRAHTDAGIISLQSRVISTWTSAVDGAQLSQLTLSTYNNLTEVVGITITPTTVALLVPTITDFTNAPHTHQNAAGGGTLDAAAIGAGTLAIARGGTGFGSYTAGDLLVANNAGTLVKLPLGTNGQVLSVNTGVDPKYQWIPAAGAGTVTSVALTVPSILSVAGSPITSAGTLAVTLASQNANLVFAGPSSGSATTPTFRALVQADLPVRDFTTMILNDHFISGNSSNGTIGEMGWSMQGTWTWVTAEASHPGIGKLATGASSGTLAEILDGFLNTAMLPAELFDLTWIVRLNTNDANTTSRFGVRDSSASSQPVNGIYFEKLDADTNWFAVSRKAGTQTRTTMATAIDTNFHKFRIRRIDASTIGFSIDGGTEVTIATANIPVAGVMFGVDILNSTTASKTIDIDRFYCVVTGMTP